MRPRPGRSGRELTTAAVIAIGLIVILAILAFLGYRAILGDTGLTPSSDDTVFVILGWLASLVLTPFGEPAFRMNLFAGLTVATAAGLTVALVRQLTRQTASAVATGLGLAASPLAWRVGTHAEPHALHLAFVGALLVLLVGWDLDPTVPLGPPAGEGDEARRFCDEFRCLLSARPDLRVDIVI